MKLVFGSEIKSFVEQFRDYIFKKYNIEMEINTFFDETSQVRVYGLFMDEHDDLFETIQQEKRIFLQDPFNDKYIEASWENGKTQDISYNISYKLTSFLPKISSLYQKKFTFFITALCVGIYLLQLIGFNQEILNLFHYPADILQKNDFWRYLSHTLVHLSPWHILFNLTWWWLFGGEIERQLGIGKIISIYIIAGIMSGIVQNHFSGYAFFGLSGVVYAVLGYVFVVSKLNSTTQFDVPSGFLTMLIIGIAIGFISPFIGINMGNAAHITGLIIGLILGGLHSKFNLC